MIFSHFTIQLLDHIDLIVEYHDTDIQIHLKWSSKTDFIRWKLSYFDDECTLPSTPPLFYLCSAKTSTLNPTFYPYWFLLDTSFYRRLFSHMINDDDHLILLLSLSDGRILALPEAAKDLNPIIWYTSPSPHPVLIIGFDYDLNTNLLDAVLASTTKTKFPKMIINHLLLCNHLGSLILVNSLHLHRILIDNFIQSACIYSNQLLYITKNEIRSISISNLFKPSNDELINQSKILRFGHFEKLLVDGQEIILYYQNGTFERLNNLLPSASHHSRIHSLSNQTTKLARLTTTIVNLQSQASFLQRMLTKIEIFYQLNLSTSLKFINHQWKLILNEQQLRIFQPNDFFLILLCHFSSTNLRIYQLNLSNHWIFNHTDSIFMTCLCQPILFLRYQTQFHYRVASKKLLLPLQEHLRDKEISLEDYFPKKFKKNHLSIEQYHLALTIRNDAALNFKKSNWNFTRRILDHVNIECKHQEMKVDTDAGLVDALTIQLILSSSCLRRLIITFSALTELFDGEKLIAEKHLIKQTDISKLIELIQDTQTKLSNYSDQCLLNLLQIRIYFSLFRLGSNYTIQVY